MVEEVMYTMYCTVSSTNEWGTIYCVGQGYEIDLFHTSIIYVIHLRLQIVESTFYINFIEQICFAHEVRTEARPIAMDERNVQGAFKYQELKTQKHMSALQTESSLERV